jgi:hypothetical protein
MFLLFQELKGIHLTTTVDQHKLLVEGYTWRIEERKDTLYEGISMFRF